MRTTLPILFAVCLLGSKAWAVDQSIERRKQALDVLLKVLPQSSGKITGRITPHDKTWEDWVRRTGELPPDFDIMPSIPELPDPLLLQEGSGSIPITTPEQWDQQRRSIRAQFEQWVFGRMPPAPRNLRATVTATRREGGVTVRDVQLDFGPGHRAKLRLELFVPSGPGPFPVFLTNSPLTRAWVNVAVRRGYIGCTYFATDPQYGREDDSDGFVEAFPGYDFSCLARWAWAGMRAVDYLWMLPEVNKKQIAITGHSRNGKQAMLAAAFDDRIGAVVPSSGLTGDSDPWRYTSSMFVNESIEQITGMFPHWFHPRLRFFAGREQKLPVDQNMLAALVAPRGLMLYSAYSEGQGNPLGYEQMYRSVRSVYRFLGQEERLALNLRPGEHPTTAGDIEQFIDFFDTVFGRTTFPRPETWVNGYTFERWQSLSRENVDPLRYPVRSAGGAPVLPALRERLLWALGSEPDGVRYPSVRELQSHPYTSDGWLAAVYRRPLKVENMASIAVPFGDSLKGDLYYPANDDGSPRRPDGGKWPVVVWLHPYSYQMGYSRMVEPRVASLGRRGFAVFAFDQIGFGTRVLDARRFYERYPHWSLMGKMVADTRAAIDAVSTLEAIDNSRIYLAGYALGGKVGLYTVALDKRVAALALVCGLSPLALDSAAKGAEGIRHYSHLHGLMPRLGFFIGHENRLPVDDGDLLALIAPRPVRIVAPQFDRYNPVEDVRAEVDEARRVYKRLGKTNALVLETPRDFNRFPREIQEPMFDWLAHLSAR